MEILQNEPMKKHTTMKVGGPADTFITTDSIAAVKKILKEPEPVFILGNGSNIIVRDKGIRGIVLKFTGKKTKVKGITIQAESGIMLRELAQLACDSGLSGLEFAKDIPGTLGGAVYMNAGAWGQSMKNIVRKVNTLDREGAAHTFETFGFRHRKSCFQKNKHFIYQVEMMLEIADPLKIAKTMQEFNLKRRHEQPTGYPSCGTVFKKGRKHIYHARLAGYRIGDAEISTKNPGFIVNRAAATAGDIERLIKYVKKQTNRQIGKKLKLEIQVVGEE
jgi:UDP-N-acetylmuramate dehydrogenase